MSSTAQCQKQPEQKQGTWNQIFPMETGSVTQSTLFVKKLVAVAVSNVTYLRAIFPESAFGDRCLDDLNLKVLRDDSSCPGACQVIKWVKGCFDAIDRKFLKIMIVGLYMDPKDPNTVIESYTFKFSYDENTGVDIYRNKTKVSSARTMDEIKKATVRLLRTIVVLTQTLSSLPDKVHMTMKLLYYDDVTPEDYEPPGFHAADKSSYCFDSEPMNIKVGDVFTPFHTVKMRIKTDASQFQMGDDPLVDNDETLKTTGSMNVDKDEIESINLQKDDEFLLDRMSQNKAQKKQQKPSQRHTHIELSQDFSQSFGNQVVPEPNVADSVRGDTPMRPGILGEAEATMPSQLSLTGEEDLGVRCPCGCNEDDGLMILCCVCTYWQHAYCFKIRGEDQAPERHICNLCGDPERNDRTPTDPHLHDLSDVAVQATCLWRRTLLACDEANKLMAPSLARRIGVEMSVAQGLMSKLESEKVVKSSGRSKRLAKVVDKEQLTICIKRYFGLQSHEKTVQAPTTSQQRQKAPEFASDNQGKSQKTAKNIDNEVDNLVNRTGSLDVSGQWKAKIPATKSDTKDERRGKKRAKSVSSDDFEVSDSQDDFDLKSSDKRHKASESKRMLRV